MTTFSTDIHIDAPLNDVWHALADIGDIARWNPGVERSHATTDEPTGLGAGRRCELEGGNYLDEKVVTWQPGQALTMRIVDTDLPFASADIRFTLQPEDRGTRVTVSPKYELKYGPLGVLLDKLMVRRTYQRGMEDLLQGLKEHVEREQATAPHQTATRASA